MATNREIYDNIAESWYGFRHRTRFRKELEELAIRWQQGRLLNLGCGHGPDFLPFKNSFELHGMDFSSGMIKQAMRYSQKYDFQAKLVIADLSHLPYKDESFDWAISIAALHHVKESIHRDLALMELKRVLKQGSEAFITVWNRSQRGFWLKGKETMVDWKTKDEVYHRYYYLFTYGEIKKEVMRAGFQVVSIRPEKTYKLPVKYFSRNICLLVRKP